MNTLFSNRKIGFRACLSTEDALISLVDEVINNVEYTYKCAIL